MSEVERAQRAYHKSQVKAEFEISKMISNMLDMVQASFAVSGKPFDVNSPKNWSKAREMAFKVLQTAIPE